LSLILALKLFVSAFEPNFSRKLENITENTEDLQDFEEKLGSNADTKSFRAKMRDKVDLAQKEIKETLNLLSEIEQLDLKTKTEQENRNKMAKRFRDVFNKEKEKFTQCIKNINVKEKIHIDLAKRSLAQNNDSFANSDMMSSSRADDMQIQEINYNEELINDRQEDIDKVKNAINLMNDINKQQALEIKKQGEDLEVVVDNIVSSKENVQKANKELDIAYKYEKSSSRKNLYLCLIILGVAIMIVVIILFVK